MYTDDVIAVSENPQALMDTLGSFYLLKEDSVGEPSTYLGAGISKYVLDGDDCATRVIGSAKYMTEALRVVRRRSAPHGLDLMSKIDLDFLVNDTAIVHMQLIGILCWVVEFG